MITYTDDRTPEQRAVWQTDTARAAIALVKGEA